MRLISRSLAKRWHKYWMRVEELHTYHYLGLKFMWETRPELKAFTDSHPHTIRMIKLFSSLHEWWDDLTHEPTMWWHRQWDAVLKGPRRLNITSLNRRNHNEHEEIMLHAAFQVLVDFVETEVCYEAPDEVWEMFNQKRRRNRKRQPEIALHYLESTHNESHREIHHLYTWWVNVGSKFADFEFEVSEDLAKEIMQSEDDRQRYRLESNFYKFIEIDCNQMLFRLIAARKDLWI